MKKLFKTALFIVASLTLGTSSSAIVISIPFTSIKNENQHLLNHDNLLVNLKNEISSQSYAINSGKYYRLNGKTFSSENDLNQEIFTNGDLKTFVTMSKPEDILLDAAHGILNPEKIEDLDLKNYQQVYRTLYDQVVFDENQALESFANEKNLIQQYSYDGVN